MSSRKWKNRLPAIDSIVCLIDATDRNRFTLGKAELDSLLSDEQVANVPIVILSTKRDLEEAIDDEELCEELGLVSATESTGRPIQVFTCDVRCQRTFGQAFRWLRNYLKDI